MRKLLNLFASIGFLLASLTLAVAQGTVQSQLLYPENYQLWSFQSQSANTYTFNGNCFYFPNQQGFPQVFAFGNSNLSIYNPVWIQDAAPANSEIVTPTALSTVSGSCGFSASPANQHISFTVRSGTAGIQDVVTALYQSQNPNQPYVVLINKQTYANAAGLPGSLTIGKIIQALTFGSQNVKLVDITTTPQTEYAWNGAHYFSNGGGVPVLAAGAGLGTGPTGLIVNGKGTSGVVSLTTGTSTATGALFTLTYPSGTTSTGFNHSPTCTFAQVGANAISGTMAASVSGSASAGYVVTNTISTTALTASTFYSISYSCS